MLSTYQEFTYAYLISPAHSGSTLLACLLDAHPEVSSVGEFTSEWAKEGLKCSCGERYADCSFWRKWAERARDDGIEFDVEAPGLLLQARHGAGLAEDLFFHQFRWKTLDRVRDLLYRPDCEQRRRATSAIDRSIRLAALLCRMQRTKVFFDTSKNPLQLRFLSAHPGLQLKVVSLVRDGRGTVSSLMKHYGKSLDEAIDAWLYSIRNQERALLHYSDPQEVFRLRLEDFCRDPSGPLHRLFNFLGVDPDTALDCSDASRRHITGNTMRLKFDGTIRCDESWRTKLSAADLRRFELRAGRLNRHLGYAD